MTTPAQSIAAKFAAIVGAQNVLTGEADRIFYSEDIAWPHRRAAVDAVVRVPSVEALAQTVRLAAADGIAIFPRGGGYTYTGCYTPDRTAAITLDLGLLKRIDGIDAENGTVTVEAGVTWGQLHDALEAKTLRAPSYGPLSGFGATIGGSASTDASFFGSASYGNIGAHVAGLDIVRADGTITKSGAQTHLFIGDCGALGVKARVTLRTIKRPKVTVFASFAFASIEPWIEALIALKGLDGLSEAFGFDPGAHRNLAKTGFSILESAAIAGDLLRARGNWFDKLGGVLRTARAGKAFVADLGYSLHVAICADNEEQAARSREQAARIAAAHHGDVIPDIIPRVTHARPFRPVKSFLGPEGENWMPVNAILPLENGVAAARAIDALWAPRAAALQRYEIRTSTLTLLTKDRLIIEPQIFWPDRLSAFHLRMAPRDVVQQYGARAPNPAARAAAHALRDVMRDTLDGFGAHHYQVGRYYDATRDTLHAQRRALKIQLDPKRVFNPGVLGL